MNLALTSDFPSSPNAVVTQRLLAAASSPRVAWIAPQSSLAARARFLSAQLTFRSLGVERLEYCALDVDAESIHLDRYDAVYLTGGDPVLFRSNIQRTGFGPDLRSFLESSRPIVAASGGAMQLTANVSLFRLLVADTADVISDLAGYEGLHIVPYEILPHLNRHNDAFLEKVRLYSERISHGILALADGAAMVYTEGRPAVTGKAARFFRGTTESIEQWPFT